jgi:plastocyanin
MFALVIVLQLLLRVSIAISTSNYTNIPYAPFPSVTASVEPCLSGTDRRSETYSDTGTLPSWTSPFHNVTWTSPCCTPHPQNTTKEPTTTMPLNQTSPSHPTSTVTVGAGGELVFSPSTLNATLGTIVSFNFLSLNHTLTQSTLSSPCHSNGRFDTGFRQFNPANESGVFVVNYEVTSLAPQWFFCAQTINRSHCKAGMVFSLNPRGAQKQFLQNVLSAVTTAREIPSASSCIPHFDISTGKGSPTSTAGATFNVSSIRTTPTSILTPIENGASAHTFHVIPLALAWILFE